MHIIFSLSFLFTSLSLRMVTAVGTNTVQEIKRLEAEFNVMKHVILQLKADVKGKDATLKNMAQEITALKQEKTASGSSQCNCALDIAKLKSQLANQTLQYSKLQTNLMNLSSLPSTVNNLKTQLNQLFSSVSKVTSANQQSSNVTTVPKPNAIPCTNANDVACSNLDGGGALCRPYSNLATVAHSICRKYCHFC